MRQDAASLRQYMPIRELMTEAELFEFGFEGGFGVVGVEVGEALVATEVDGVVATLSLVSL
jgi:hypothetical protein